MYFFLNMKKRNVFSLNLYFRFACAFTIENNYKKRFPSIKMNAVEAQNITKI
jgi:hypothetical protein